jgi:hypothetical protein
MEVARADSRRLSVERRSVTSERSRRSVTDDIWFVSVRNLDTVRLMIPESPLAALPMPRNPAAAAEVIVRKTAPMPRSSARIWANMPRMMAMRCWLEARVAARVCAPSCWAATMRSRDCCSARRVARCSISPLVRMVCWMTAFWLA